MQFEIRSDIIIVLIAGTMLLIFLVGFIISFVRFYQKKKILYNKNLNLIQVRFQQELLQTQNEIQEQTLKNISQEIHDNIGQALALAKLNINTMANVSAEQLNEKIEDSKYLIAKAINDLRDLSKSLNTDYVTELGLVRSVEYELELLKKTTNYDIQFTKKGKPYRFEKQKELILFRIIQEALHNIIKHSKAGSIDITLTFEPDLFTLIIIDDGLGFEPSSLELNSSGAGLGIRNMRNRANMISANFEVTSIIQKGTTIVLKLPLQ